MLNQIKGIAIGFKFFRFFCLFLLVSFVILVTYWNRVEGFYNIMSNNGGFLRNEKGELKVKIKYLESPNNPDYFKFDSGKYLGFGGLSNLDGTWRGTYVLVKDSIIWTNPSLEKEKILEKTFFGPYEFFLNFKLDEKSNVRNLEILQNDLKYSSANFELVKDKQINYWAKAIYKNWLEVVRGKIYKRGQEELFTQFQTTVYEEKIPIYAFAGEAMLYKTFQENLLGR